MIIKNLSRNTFYKLKQFEININREDTHLNATT